MITNHAMWSVALHAAREVQGCMMRSRSGSVLGACS